MTNFKQFAGVVIFAALACTGLHAQSLNLRATIPFDFHAGDKLMPAGEYVVHNQGPVVFVSGADRSSPHTLLMTNGAARRASSPPAGLTFNHYGSEYFLETIWSPSVGDGRKTIQTSREKELAKRGNDLIPDTVTIASSK
jgi:hypothetical protein